MIFPLPPPPTIYYPLGIPIAVNLEDEAATSVNSSCAQPPPPPPSSWATAGHLPAFSDPGVGHLHILRSPGTRHFSTPARGYFRAFDMHVVSYQNITTQRILLEKSMFSILCMYFFIAYEARNT